MLHAVVLFDCRHVCTRSGDAEWHEGQAGGSGEGERETAGQEGAVQGAPAVSIPPPRLILFTSRLNINLCVFYVNSATNRCFCLCLQKAGEAEGEEEKGGAEEENRQFIV